MDWITPRRLGIIGSVGFAVFFAGFTTCKLAGSEPNVSWRTGLLYALGFGGFLAGWLLCFKSKAATTEKLFYGEKKRKNKNEEGV